MILPVIAYGNPVLKKQAREIEGDSPELQKLIDDMLETMYNASGVGLAAPQVGKSIRLFIADSIQLEEREEFDEKGIREVFINPVIEETSGEEVVYNEGCLSIPTVREDITRPEFVTIRYLDRDFKEKNLSLEGFSSRIVQHEFDHIEGILFTDHLKALRKRFLKRTLKNISRGKVKTDYKMDYPL